MAVPESRIECAVVQRGRLQWFHQVNVVRPWQGADAPGEFINVFLFHRNEPGVTGRRLECFLCDTRGKDQFTGGDGGEHDTDVMG